MAWAVEPLKNENMANWQIEPARVAEQTVLDDDTGQIYRAPVTFDEQDIRFAIATQVNKEPKRDFIGKVKYAAGEAWNWAEKFADRVEGGFQSAERGAVGLAGQALDTFLHASLSVPARVEQIEKYKNGDFSDWDASLNGRVTDEDIAKEADPALQAAMQFRKDRQDALMAKAEERLEQRQRIRRKLDASIRKWQEVLRPEAEMNNYDRFMEAMGSGTASLALSVATLAATKNPQVAAGIMAGTFGRMRYTDVFDKSVEKGLDYATADDYATIAGTIEGGIELALEPFLYGVANLRPVRKITDEMIGGAVARLNATAAGKSAARKIVSKHRQSVGKQSLKAAAIEGSEEALQEAGGAYFENYTGLENTPQEEIMARTLLSFAVGGLTGAGAAVMGTSAYNREAAATNERIKQSLAQAYPELTTEEKQKTADALQEIFYQDGEGRMLNELELLADKENDPDTLESGKHEISEDMRSILKKRYQMSDEEIDRTAEIAVASIDLRNQFNEAQTAFYDELVKIGTNPNVAEPFSRLMAARASAVAMNEKKTVKDVLERWNLKFERKTRPIDYNALLDDEILFQSEAYDTQGKADINTPEFKAWFGGSKVVDESGQPRVVYHGTPNLFSAFDKAYLPAPSANDPGFYGQGFYFADSYPASWRYTRGKGVILPLYLSIKNPLVLDDVYNKTMRDIPIERIKELGIYKKGLETGKYAGFFFDEYVTENRLSKRLSDHAKAEGYDGIKAGKEFVVFEPNQIKSVYNRGTWNARNDNIYYQRAYAGSRVDYGRPSLEAIGSGEGAQAHGWGLYYALDKDVAEGYRERFINEYGEGIVEYNGVVYKNNDDYAHFLLNLKQTKKGEIARQREIAKFFNENGNIELAKKHKKLAEEGENINVDDIKTLGQVHEVEIPENPFLLDEQLPFSEQPEIVKQGIKNAIKEISEDAEKQIQALENKDFIGREIYNKISLFLAKTPGTLADKETSLLLEKYGIKGITYDGRQDGRAFVIFNPDDVQVIQKFYQLPQDDLNNVIDGHEVIEGFDENAPDDAFVRTKEGRVEHGYITDELAKQIGSSKGGEIRLYNDLDKHIDKGRKKYILSQGYADLIDFVDDTISNWEKIYKGSDESFLITKSKNKDNIVAVKLEQDGKYYKISTALISRKDYLKNKKTLAERAQSNQLLTKSPGAISGTSDIYNIAPTRENVKPDYQNKPQPKGLYDASKRVIKIFESADFSTLPHEIAHYWLDNMWSYVRSGNASEKYRQRWNVIANWLNVKSEQAVLTRGQQEKFARGYEQYLLNGDLPTPIIKGAFDDYDRWLKRVYGDMNRLNVRLSEDAVRFFQSMTTGILPPPRIRPSRKPREKMTTAEKLREQLGLQEQDRQEKETVKLVEEMETARLEPDSIDARTVIVSNITEGETGKSRVYSREVERNIDALQEIADIDLDYNKIRLEEQAQRAADFVKNNLEDARKIIDGRKPAPENILDTAIRIAYEQEMLRIGDNAEYLRALKLHSSLQTLRGQEIVAERISTKDIASPTYWINKLVAHRTYKAASKIFKGYAEAVGGDSPVDLYKKMIKNETDRITKKVLAEKTREEQQKVLNAELKRLRYEYGTGVQGELFQLPLEPLNARNAKMYVREALDDIFGTTVSQEEANQIIGKIGEIEKSIVNTLDETGNPSVQTWQKINEMNNLVESLTPSPALQIATSIVGRGMMLSSIKSPVLNVVSNTENILTEMLIRRAVNSLEGGASFSAVDKNVEKDYLAYADDVYRASGYNVSTTEGLDAATVTLGERRISTQGAGKFRAFARGVETGVFKYLMGYPDSRAKDFVFSDTAALEATTIAQNEGLSGEMLSKRATELYRDATRVAPLTEEGMLIREKAMMEANVATYTNDTAFSKFALGIRETLNKVTGNVRLGDQLMPFVKTPANVVALGMEYSIGAAYLIPNLTTVIRDVKAGKLSAKSWTAIKAAVRNGLGVVLAMLIAMALDPDDYTPDYDALTMSERRLALEKNAVFNSIRIGDKYISLDYFGPLAVPLTAVLSARRRGEVAWFGYAKGVASQLQKLPGLQEFSETVDAIGRATSNKPEKTVKNLNNALIDFVRARTIPSIVNDLAKSIDTYERETSAGTYDKAQASVPGIREELPLKYTTTSRTPKETEAALSILLFGARVKTAASNRVIYEIDRLYKKNAKPTITDVTRSGKLSELSEAKQQRVRKEFAKRYYDGVYTLIRTREYRAKDDEQRAAAINKVRRQIIEQLKKEYIK